MLWSLRNLIRELFKNNKHRKGRRLSDSRLEIVSIVEIRSDGLIRLSLSLSLIYRLKSRFFVVVVTINEKSPYSKAHLTPSHALEHTSPPIQPCLLK